MKSFANFRLKKTDRSMAIALSTALLGAAVLMVAQADERDTKFNQRFYVGAGVGVTQLEPKTNHSSLSVSENTDTGFHIAAGYDFTTRLSAEIYYADLGAASIAFLNQDVGEVDYKVFGLSAIGYLFNSQSGFRANSSGNGLALRTGLSVYGRVGIGGVSADSELDYKVNHAAHLALGLGAEYGFRNGFAIRGEYMALDTDQQYATLSLVKRFGSASKAAPLAAIAPAIVPAVETPKAAVIPETKLASIGPISTVNFEFDQSGIMPTAANRLDEIAAAVSGSNSQITLEGHTDWISTETYNYDLSLKRADSVRRYLESKGISRSRMTVRGFGEKRPMATNATDEGRASNRRVDIRINK